MASCDVCNKEVTKPDGFLLSAKQVTECVEYWEYAFAHQWANCEQNDPDGEHLETLAAMQVSRNSDWLVCAECIKLFDAHLPTIAKDLARGRCEAWWEAGDKWPVPRQEPYPHIFAFRAAKEGWHRAFGKPPRSAIPKAKWWKFWIERKPEDLAATVRERIRKLSSEELRKMVGPARKDYTDDALKMAREELERRGEKPRKSSKSDCRRRGPNKQSAAKGQTGLNKTTNIGVINRPGPPIEQEDNLGVKQNDARWLQALLIIFDHDFSPKDVFVNSILERMRAHGKTYKQWIIAATSTKVLVAANAQDPTVFLARATVNFRLLGWEPVPERIEYATFEGSQGISGVIVSLWAK